MGFQVAINEFADMSDEEFREYSSGSRSLKEEDDDSLFYDYENQREILDYSYDKYLHPELYEDDEEEKEMFLKETQSFLFESSNS